MLGTSSPIYKVEGETTCVDASFIEDLQTIFDFLEVYLVFLVVGLSGGALFLFFV
jgi:hypothetical protein